jgi:DNA-binding SARP family transcriptional activator
MLMLRTFGGVALLRDGQPVVGPSSQRRRLALLALLGAAGTRGASRDSIVALLWPDSEPERGRHALAQWLFLLRKDLEVDDIVLGTATLRLNPDKLRSDVGSFDDAIARRDYAAAAELYAGPFLDGLTLGDAIEFEQWVDRERESRHREALTALEALARDTATGDHASRVTAWRRLARLDPLSSRVAIGVIQALRDAGDDAAALAHAQRHEDFLRRELDVPPSRELQELIAELRKGARAGFRAIDGGEQRDDPFAAFVRGHLADRFSIERLTLRTSLTTLFEAVRCSDGAPVTLKVLLPEIVARVDADTLYQTLLAASRIVHPAIAPLGEVGRADGLVFIAAPRGSEHMLRDSFDRDGRLSLEQTLKIGVSLASGLAQAHASRIPHLDLTPRRILIGNGRILLADHGVMFALQSAQQTSAPDRSGIALGTPAYMSPEQLDGDAAGAESDIYSLGCVIFHVLAGQPPHTAANSRGLIARRLRGVPPRVRDYVAEIPEEIDALLAGMLARSPADRPGADEVASAFTRVRDHLPG